MTSSNWEKLLSIFLDSKLNFESHVGSLCRKAGQKINALARLKNALATYHLPLNSVIKSRFTYCPLIWMFTSRYLNNASNDIHEQALRWIYSDMRNRLIVFLTENNHKIIHQKNLTKISNFKWLIPSINH